MSLWVALIAALAQVFTVLYTHRRSAKAIEQVHLLVNDRMTNALDKIANLEMRLGVPPSESEEKAAERKLKAVIDKPALDALNRPAK